MSEFKRRSRFTWALPIIVLVAACTDGGAPTGPDESFAIQPTVYVNDEVGTDGQFAFLQPLVDGDPSGPLATGLHPLITICNTTAGGDGDCIELEAKEEDDHYHANWKDKTAEPEETYTITVNTSFGLRIGELDLFLDGLSGDKAGRTFPIKFWVGEGLGDAILAAEDCIGDDRCNAEPVPADEPAPVVLTTMDENGEPMGVLTFPSGSVPTGGLVVTLDCRKDGFLPTQGPLPTALRQWPLFCSVVARNPDGTQFTGTLTPAATIDICIVDELEPGQDPLYHGFDQDDLVLGKSNGPGNFEFLTEVPTGLECEGNTYTAMNEQSSPFDVLGSRFASAVGFFMPQPLRAAPMRFRDGGVGGQLGSFSDINPVEPAYISGSVSHVSGGIAGVTVTLSGDASDFATTDAGGFYQFGPLQAAPTPGSSYTVTVTTPAGETIADPDTDVVVTGSGTTTVDFLTELPAGMFYYPPTGNYYTSVATPAPWATANTNAQALPDFRMCEPGLATVLSAGEDNFIVTNMPQAATGPGGGYWLGGYQEDDSVEPGGGWFWVTGQTIPGNNAGPPYANWASGEPNNVNGGTENALQYIAGFGSPSTSWNDEPEGRSYGYLVEYSCSVPE